MQLKKLKHLRIILTLLLIVTIIAQNTNVVTAASSTLNITGYASLSTLNEGQAFIVKGTVSSNYTINRVSAYITTSSGSTKYSTYATPNAKSYNISGLDSALRFDKLTAGSYIFKVDASDSSGTSKNLLKQTFTVNAVTSTLSISNYSTISSINVGQAFSIKGTVQSNYSIQSVTAKIVDTSNVVKYTKSANPYSKSYNISGLDDAMYFNKLTAGSYVFKVEASDSSGTSKLLLNQSFTVKATSSTSNISISGYNSLSSLNQGQAFSVKGVISSTNNISKVTAYISTRTGSILYTASATPNAKTYNVAGLDSAMKFDKLSAGDYVFKIDAVDSTGFYKNVLKQEFTVKGSSGLPTGDIPSRSKWLSDCGTAFKYYKDNGFTYGLNAGEYVAPLVTNQQACCAGYVSWCLYRNNFFSKHSDGTECAQELALRLYKRFNWEMNTDITKIKPGDIIYYNQNTITESQRQNNIQWLKDHNPGAGSAGMHIDISYDPSTYSVYSAGSASSIKSGTYSSNGSTWTKNHFVCSFRYPKE